MSTDSTVEYQSVPKIFGRYGSRSFLLEETVAIAGDWHGDGRWAISALKELSYRNIHVIYHVGDFGLWLKSDADEYMTKVERTLKRYDQIILITPGNHENYARLNKLPVSADGLQWVSDHIAVMPRGYRWTIGEKTLLSLGGAPSINFYMLKENINWWKEEILTPEDIADTIAAGETDIMIAHDAPDGILHVFENVLDKEERWPDIGLNYAQTGRESMTRVVGAVKPKMFFHGHYHIGYMEDTTFTIEQQTFTTQVVGLHKERNTKNVALLDIPNMTKEWFIIGSY